MSETDETAATVAPAAPAAPAAAAAPAARVVPRGTQVLGALLVLCALVVVGVGSFMLGGSTQGPSVVDAPEFDAGDVENRAGNLTEEPRSRGGTETAADAGTGSAPEVSPVDDAIAARLAEEEARLAERARLASDAPLRAPVTGAEELVERWRSAEPDAEAAKAAAASPDPGVLPQSGTMAEAAPAPPPAAEATRHMLARGSVIPAVLESSIDSDLPGLVRAWVAETVYDTVTGGHVLIPRGSRLVGTYGSGAPTGQRRLFVSWTDLLLPDGTPVPLGGTASLGADGASGVRGRRSTGIWSALGAAVLFDLAGNASQILIASETGQSPQRQDGLAEILGEAVGNSTSQVGQEHLRELLDRGTRFRVAAGARMNVLVEENMHLPAQPARGAW